LTLETNELSKTSSNPLSATRNSQSLSLTPHETRRIVLTLKSGSPALRARLNDDALKVDNEVVLLPEAKRPVRVALRVRDAAGRALVEKAVQSARNAWLTPTDPELVITDEAETGTESATGWLLRIIAEKDAASFLGPFVMDRAHPLTAGLSLGGVVWGCGKA